MKKYICALLPLLISQLIHAQMSPVIQSARPGQSIGTGVVGSGTFQIQSGIDQSWITGQRDEKVSLLNSVLRLGISKTFEVSSVVNYQSNTADSKGQSFSKDGLSSLQIGFRSKIISSSDGLIPALAIQTRFKLDTISSKYRSQNDIAPVIIISTGHALNDSVSLTNNLGVSYDGTTAIPNYFMTSNVAYSISKNWGTFIEVYGNAKDDYSSLYADTGFEYFLNNNLKLDVSGGWGNNRGTTETFVSLGFSWRTSFFEPLTQL